MDIEELEEIEKELVLFEKDGKKTSEEFYQGWLLGKERDTYNNNVWAMLHEAKKNLVYQKERIMSVRKPISDIGERKSLQRRGEENLFALIARERNAFEKECNRLREALEKMPCRCPAQRIGGNKSIWHRSDCPYRIAKEALKDPR